MKQAESEYFTYLLKKKKTHKWNKDTFSLKKKIDIWKKNTLYQEKKKEYAPYNDLFANNKLKSITFL